jgi:thiol-disulfide isomerase/thioredoxin
MLFTSKCLVRFFFFLIILHVPQFLFAQTGHLTIKGKMILVKENVKDANEGFFFYTDIYSGEKIIIPVTRDSANNFSVDMILPTYQEISFGKIRIQDKQPIYNTGVTYFTFFAKPNQNMHLILTQKLNDLSIEFSGDFSSENSQYRAFQEEEQKVLLSIYQGTDDKKFTIEQVQDLVLKFFLKSISFNDEYFRKNINSQFIQQQVYFNTLYGAKDAFMNFNLLSRNQLTEAKLSEFDVLLANEIIRYKTSHNNVIKYVMDPNPDFKNSGAIGNIQYKSYLDSYFNLILNNINIKSNQNISNKEFAAFILKKYSNLKQTETTLLKEVIGRKSNNIIQQENDMAAFRSQYINEYLQTLERRDILRQFLNIRDPFFRDLSSTRYLFKKINFTEIDYLILSIDEYSKKVLNADAKNNFLKAYKTQLTQLHDSKMPPLAILHELKNPAGSNLLDQIIANYKGKVVYLDLWATWCAPCIAGMESSQKLKSKFSNKDVVFVYLCVSSPNQNGWKSVIAAKNLEGENYFLDPGQSSAILKTLNVSGIPRYVIVDSNGNYVEKDASKPSDPNIFKKLDDLIKN